MEAPTFVMRMYNIHAPATIVAADRHYARHHTPIMTVFNTKNFRLSPLHNDEDCPRGSFGRVYFRIHGLTEVAVKEPFSGDEAKACFLNEISVVGDLPHSMNVVRTLGLAYRGPVGCPPYALVMTKYANTFHTFLSSGGRSYASQADAIAGSTSLESFGYTRLLVHLLAGIANGLAHLHACGIVHNDLSESNVFVEDPSPGRSSLALPEAIVADMGRASREEACGEIEFACRWLAKRTVHETRLSPASDVFSFGTIVLSALGGVNRAYNVHCMSMSRLGSVQPSSFITDCALDPRLLDHIVAELRMIVKTCTDPVPANRPSAVRVRDSLRRLMNET